MYSVSVTAKSKEQLAQVIDRLLLEGIEVRVLTMPNPTKGRPVALLEDKRTHGGKRTRQGPPGQSMAKLLEVISKTFGDGTSFNPKQVAALAIARGVPRGSIYTSLAALAKNGSLSRPKPGFYALVVERKE